MPLLSMSGSAPSPSHSQQVQQYGEQQQQRPRLVYATSNKHNPDSPVELTFVVADETGNEKTIIVKDIDSGELFFSTQEGQNWIQQTKDRLTSQQKMRRSA